MTRTSARLLILVTVVISSIAASSAATTLYLRGDGLPVASMVAEVPDGASLPNHDPSRDDFPGLLVSRGGTGVSETDPTRYQQWVGPSTGATLAGHAALEFWGAMAGFATGSRGVVEAFLLDCDPSGQSCSLIAQSRKDIFDWSGGWSSWTRNSMEFGDLDYTVPEGRSLSVKLIIGADSDDDMWIAYDSLDHPSRLTDQAPADIVIDGEFSDWSNAGGTEFTIVDQGGVDDWASPAKLDITRFAVSSNLVDTFHLLIGFDDVPPQKTTAATLIDNDLDNNVNFAVVATLNRGMSTVVLYSCDDTVTHGCGGATRQRVYPSSFFRTGTVAGPWNDDSLLEMALPFNDLSFQGGVIVFTSLASYASAASLVSPKDSVLGAEDQDYVGGIQYDTVDRFGRLIDAIGTGFVIRRHTDPSQVRTATAHSSSSRAPFDDLPGSLDDGESYFYVVEKDGGLSMKLSVHPNPVDDAVRIGFNDHDPMSAAADPFLSTVSRGPDSIPADGTAVATVTVVPRDGNGTLIGSGCDVSVDAARLLPGSLAGPVTDNRNGSYSFRVVSTDPGIASAVVSVEGIVIDTQPSITFLDP